jgi:protoheme IX farnesyltransferase
MFTGRSRPGVTSWLAAATLGVYLLVVVGATASLADAAESCSGWPACTGSLGDPAVLIAMGHNATAAVVGVVVVAAAVAVFRGATGRGVRAASALALVLYPAQIGVGAWVAASGGGMPFPGLHLVAGLGIFGALLVALAWQLEAETAGSDEPLGFDAVDPVEPSESEGVPLSERPLGVRLKARVFAYFRLMKPRLMWLLALVAAAAMALAAGPALTVGTVVFTLGGGVLAIGASGTFNHVLERDRDKKMSRTNDRPLVTHEVPQRNAIAFGLALTLLSTALFLQLNPLAAALGLTAILFYSVIYTLVLKPNTVQNTVLGGAAGSLPALIGWAGVTGRVGLGGVLLAGLIFAWTPAHFYNLALAYKEDYARGGFPMMPVVRGEATTRKHILLWLGATLAAAAALIWLTPLSWLTALTTTALGVVFLWAVLRLHREQTEQAAFRAFHAANAYLGLILVAIVVDGLAV